MATIQLSTARAGALRVPATVLHDTLAVHRAVDDRVVPIRGAWKVSHVPSGFAFPILAAPNKRAALELAERFWSALPEECRAVLEAGDVRAIQDRRTAPAFLEALRTAQYGAA